MRTPTEDSFDISALAAITLGVFDIVANAGKALEVSADIVACLFARNVELIGETEGRYAIDDAEVDGLGAAAHKRIHSGNRHAEHLARGHGVNIEPFGKGFAKLRYFGDMGEDPQLDLAIVSADQL